MIKWNIGFAVYDVIVLLIDGLYNEFNFDIVIVIMIVVLIYGLWIFYLKQYLKVSK
jgi:hypothetical protein